MWVESCRVRFMIKVWSGVQVVMVCALEGRIVRWLVSRCGRLLVAGTL